MYCIFSTRNEIYTLNQEKNAFCKYRFEIFLKNRKESLSEVFSLVVQTPWLMKPYWTMKSKSLSLSGEFSASTRRKTFHRSRNFRAKKTSPRLPRHPKLFLWLDLLGRLGRFCSWHDNILARLLSLRGLPFLRLKKKLAGAKRTSSFTNSYQRLYSTPVNAEKLN